MAHHCIRVGGDSEGVGRVPGAHDAAAPASAALAQLLQLLLREGRPLGQLRADGALLLLPLLQVGEQLHLGGAVKAVRKAPCRVRTGTFK